MQVHILYLNKLWAYSSIGKGSFQLHPLDFTQLRTWPNASMSWTRLTAGTMIPHELSIFEHRQRELHRNLSKFRLRSVFVALDHWIASLQIVLACGHFRAIGRRSDRLGLVGRRVTSDGEAADTGRKTQRNWRLDKPPAWAQASYVTRFMNLRDALKVREALS